MLQGNRNRQRGVSFVELVVALAVLAVMAFAGSALALTGGTSVEIKNGVVSLTTIGVPLGGTGQVTLTDRAVLIGRGTAGVEAAAPGNAGGVLRSTGAASNPAFGALDLADNDAVGSSILGVANGGLNLSASADDNVPVGNGTTWQSKALTDCDGPTNAVTYDTATNVWGCNTISGGTTIPSRFCFSTVGTISAGQTVHMSAGTTVDASQGRAQNIMPSNATLENLRCTSSVAPGGAETITITMGDGTCTGALTDSTGQVCTLSASGRTCVEAGASEAVTAGACYSFKAVASAGAAESVVSCCTEATS